MRILMICTEKLPVPPFRGGAVQTYVHETATRLAGYHSVTVLGVQDPELPVEGLIRGVRYVRIPGGILVDYTDGVVAFLAANRFDLIHVFNRPRLVMPIRTAAPDARIILSMHNDMFEETKIQPGEAEQVLNEVDAVITVSNYVGQRLSTLYPQAQPKVRTIYSGADIDRFAPVWSGSAREGRKTLRSQHGLERKVVILHVGRLSPKKGVDVLLDAMPAVARTHSNAALVLVGSKWYGEDKVSDYVAYVRALAARSPVPVISTGFVAPDEIHRWFWAGDIFVCASQWQEPLARVHFEAMSAGLPIVTTNRGGNPEVLAGLGNGILLENPSDPASFASALARFLGDASLRDQMGRKGRILAEKRFAWERVAREILAVWERS